MRRALRIVLLLGLLVAPPTRGPAAAQEPPANGESWELLQGLGRCRRVDIEVPTGPCQRAARHLAHDLIESLGLEVSLDPEDRDPDALRILAGGVLDPALDPLARRLGLEPLPDGFRLLGHDYTRAGDALVAVFEDPARAGRPLCLVLGNGLEELAVYLDEIPRLTRPHLWIHDDGELALECPLTREGSPRAAEAIDYRERRAQYFPEGRSQTHENLVVHAHGQGVRKQWSAYARELAGAQKQVFAWLGVKEPPTVELFLYDNLEDFEHCLGSGALSLTNRLRPRVHVLLAPGMPDDGGSGLARVLARELAGAPASDWVEDGLAVAAAGQWWQRPLSQWLIQLARGKLLPPPDELFLADAPAHFSEHALLPARALLFQELVKSSDYDPRRVRALWKSADDAPSQGSSSYRQVVLTYRQGLQALLRGGAKGANQGAKKPGGAAAKAALPTDPAERKAAIQAAREKMAAAKASGGKAGRKPVPARSGATDPANDDSNGDGDEPPAKHLRGAAAKAALPTDPAERKAAIQAAKEKLAAAKAAKAAGDKTPREPASPVAEESAAAKEAHPSADDGAGAEAAVPVVSEEAATPDTTPDRLREQDPREGEPPALRETAAGEQAQKTPPKRLRGAAARDALPQDPAARKAAIQEALAQRKAAQAAKQTGGETVAPKKAGEASAGADPAAPKAERVRKKPPTPDPDPAAAGRLARSQRNAIPPFRHGLALVEGEALGYSSRAVTAALASAAAIEPGPDAVSLTVLATAEDPLAAFLPRTHHAAYGSASDLALANACAAAHASQLDVLLSLEVLAQPTGAWADVISWTATDAQEQFTARYERVALHYALLAELLPVEVYSFGSNLRESVRTEPREPGPDPELLEARREAWSALIEELHAAYRGALTYGARFPSESAELGFLDQLDLIGLQLYPRFPRLANPVDEEELRRMLRYEVQQTLDLAVRWNKPLLFLQVGFPASTNSWQRTWVPSGAPDGEAQDLYLETLAEVLGGRLDNSSSLRGYFLWNWPIDPGLGGSDEAGFSLRDKPAESALRRLFAR